MSYFKFGAKDLAESGYDSSDSTKTTVPAPAAAAAAAAATATAATAARCSHSPSTTPIQPKQKKKNKFQCRRPKTIKGAADQLARPDTAILAILHEEVTIGSRTMSILEAARPGMGAVRDRQPPFDLAVHMHNALARSGLSVQQKARLYACLEWRFECMSCGGVRGPDEFDTTLYLWGGSGEDGESVVPHVRLRGGPCRECVADARAKGQSTDILLVSINLPEACKISTKC